MESTQFQSNLHQCRYVDISILIHGYQQTDSIVYVDRQKPQTGQQNIEGKEQCWRNDIT